MAGVNSSKGKANLPETPWSKKVGKTESKTETKVEQRGFNKTTIESVFTTDAKGKRHLQSETSYYGSTAGDVNEIIKAEYDDKGQEKKLWIDDNADGKYDHTIEFQTNEDGSTTETYKDISGLFPKNKVSNTYDKQGRNILFKVDRNNDGVYDEVKETKYNEDDSFIETTKDGKGKFKESITYDKKGNVILHKQDTNGDGKADKFSTEG